jgi:hypothetical protein
LRRIARAPFAQLLRIALAVSPSSLKCFPDEKSPPAKGLGDSPFDLDACARTIEVRWNSAWRTTFLCGMNLHVPNGDVLVAESDGRAYRPDDSKGIKGKIYKMAQRRAGAGVPSPDKIVLLRDNGNGTATKYVFLQRWHLSSRA